MEPQQPYDQYQQPQSTPQAAPQAEQSDKSYVAAVLLSFFVGSLGVDRFYLGYIPTGILKLLTAGGLGIWALIDFIRIAFGSLKDKQGRTLQGYEQHKKPIRIIAIVFMVLGLLIIPGIILLMTFLAVPSLQKNARDSARKNDASMLASNIAQYQSENRGTYPGESEFASSVLPATQLSMLTENDITYLPQPAGCGKDTVPCTSYSLSYKLENGQIQTITD